MATRRDFFKGITATAALIAVPQWLPKGFKPKEAEWQENPVWTMTADLRDPRFSRLQHSVGKPISWSKVFDSFGNLIEIHARATFGLQEANGQWEGGSLWREGIHMFNWTEDYGVKLSTQTWQMTFPIKPHRTIVWEGMKQLL